MRPRWLALALLLVAVACGCGNPLATGGFKPPYVTLHGTIASTLAPPPSNVRVALLWMSDRDGTPNYAAQTVGVQSQFPAQFKLDIDALPPPSVMHAINPVLASELGVDPAMRWAYGNLIVFADNGDGIFDLVDPSTATSPDRVLAAAPDLDIFYLASGTPARNELIGIVPVAPSFSFAREPPQRDPLPGECGSFTPQGHLTSLCQAKQDTLPTPFDPASSTIELALADDPSLERYGCSAFWGAIEYADWQSPSAGSTCDGGACPNCQGYQCPLDLPPTGVTATCNGDGTAYVYKTCKDDASLCGTRFCHYGHGERQPTDPIPSGWPCM